MKYKERIRNMRAIVRKFGDYEEGDLQADRMLRLS